MLARRSSSSLLPRPGAWAVLSGRAGSVSSPLALFLGRIPRCYSSSAPSSEVDRQHAAEGQVPPVKEDASSAPSLSAHVEIPKETLEEYLQRVEKEDQQTIEEASKAFASGNAIEDHINSVLGMRKYKCVVFMYGDERNPADGEGYAVLKVLQRENALFKTFDLNKYPLLKEGLIKHRGSFIRGDEDLPHVYILGRPFGSLREVLEDPSRLEAKLRLARAQTYFYATH